jgi:chromosome segregation ATPase
VREPPPEYERIRELEEKLDAASTELRSQAQEIGRLKGVEAVVPTLQTELDRLRRENEQLRSQLDEARRELAGLQASIDARVAEQVQSAVSKLREEHEASARGWREERARLMAELEKARAGGERAATAAVKTSELAQQFRSVLEELAEPPEEGGPAGAALTGIEVDARAYLAPPPEGETLPQLVMVDPATPVQPEALSTVRLRFGLLPRLPSEAEPPPG